MLAEECLLTSLSGQRTAPINLDEVLVGGKLLVVKSPRSIEFWVTTRDRAYAIQFTIIFLILAIYAAIESVSDIRAGSIGTWFHLPMAVLMTILGVQYLVNTIWLTKHPEARKK